MTRICHAAQAALLVIAISMPAAAAQIQNPVTQSDIQGLQDNVYLAERDISQLRTRDATRASQLSTQLDDLRDEVVYLKVKLRKERTLTRAEFNDVRNRIEDVRSQARGDSGNLSQNNAGTQQGVGAGAAGTRVPSQGAQGSTSTRSTRARPRWRTASKPRP